MKVKIEKRLYNALNKSIEAGVKSEHNRNNKNLKHKADKEHNKYIKIQNQIQISKSQEPTPF